jgi:diguanylate cyclase
MVFIKELLSNEVRRKQWISIIFYAEVVVTLFILTLVQQAKTTNIMLLYFLFIAVVSNVIVYYLSEKLIALLSKLERLNIEAATDYLTGLNNVRSFDKSFNELLRKAKENDESISLLMIDIDYFKRVNDTYGHSAGDAVLKELSDIFLRSIRDFDVIARVGGEEFGIILRDCTQNRTCEIAEKIRRNVERNKFLLPCGEVINITISIGGAVYPATIADINLLKEKADEKLYESKHKGRNKISI